MRSIEAPGLDAQAVYDEITTARRPARRRTRLQQARAPVLAAYGAYADAAEDVTVLAPAATPPATAEDLRGNYSLGSAAGRKLRDAILDANAGGLCPLCSGATAFTVDHYLPRDSHPEFSVLPLNLVPACWRCNGEKGTAYASAGAALFLHAYLDVLADDEPFLLADVAVVGTGVAARFRVAPPASIPQPVRDRIVSHFERLRLAEVYAVEAAREIGTRCRSIAAQLPSGGPAVVRAYLRQEADSNAWSMGTNHWRAALLRAMAASEDVCTGAFLAPQGPPAP